MNWILGILLIIYDVVISINAGKLKKYWLVIGILLCIPYVCYVMDVLLVIICILMLYIFIKGNVHYNKKCDTLLILGYAFKDQMPVLLKNRLDTAIQYCEKYPDTTVIVSGGLTTGYISEARFMQEYLNKQGITNIILEEQAQDTFDNFNYSQPYIKEDVVVVTNHFHMYRSLLIAKKLKIKAHGLAARDNIQALHDYFEEIPILYLFKKQNKI